MRLNAAEETAKEGEKKSGFFNRLFKGKEDKQPEPAAKTTPPPAEKKPEPKAKKKEEAPAKPKAKPASKPKESSEEPSSNKPPKLVIKSRDTGKPTTPPAKPKPKTEDKPATTEAKPTVKPKSESLDSKFGKPTTPPVTAPTAPVKPTVAATPKPTTPSSESTIAPPLPSNSDLQVVKLNGRDYVTAESIQRFYRFSTLKRTGNHVWFNSATVIMKAEIGSQDLLMNSIKFILSNPVTESDGKALISRVDLCKLIDPVLRPSYITNSTPFDTVVLDAGHGGHDSGARGVYGFEKDFTLQMALAVRDALVKRGIKVKMTRDSDYFIPLHGRVEVANAIPNSILVSLHFNSSGPSATGIETFALSPQGSSSTFMGERGWDTSAFSGNRQDSENIALATAVHAMVVNKFKVIDRGIKRARFTVLTGCLRPGILFEGGFVTNAEEGRLIAAPSYRQLLANSVADGILNYRKALQPRVGSTN